MKLLVIGPEITNIRQVKNYSGVQAFYLARELRKQGVELVFATPPRHGLLDWAANLDGQGCDHILALGVRWFTHQPEGMAIILGNKTDGAVTQLYDGVVHESHAETMQGVGCTFMARDDSQRMRDWDRYAATNHYIGWAADPEVMYPDHIDNELRILIDHPYYKQGGVDLTQGVTKDALMFAHLGKWKAKYKKVRVRRLVNGGAEDVTLQSDLSPKFDRIHVPFVDIAREYRRAHVYLVTHKESVGLTCLEVACCGAIVAACRGMIPGDRLETIRHVSYDGVRAPWPTILEAIDIPGSVHIARKQTWEAVASRMLTWFRER